MQQHRATVFLYREESRYHSVRQALTAAVRALPWHRYRNVVVKPNLVSTTKPLAVTHVDALRAVLDVVREHTDAPITVAEGTASQNTWVAYHRFGYTELVRRYAHVRLLDLNVDETVPLRAYDRQLRPMPLRAARTVLDADLVISVGPPKTHDFVIVTLSIKNLIMGTLVSHFAPHRPERVDRNGAVRPLPVRALKFARGMYDRLPPRVQALPLFEFPRFFFMMRERRSDKFRMHQSYPLLNFNLFMMAWQGLWPDVSVIDGWEAMEGDGPTDGTPVPWRAAIVSTDALAADAFAATMMGYPPQEVGYLYYCWRAGLGEGDLSRVRVEGNLAPDALCRTFRPHRLIANQRRWQDPRVDALFTQVLHESRSSQSSPHR